MPKSILIVKDPWASLILKGEKKLELRTTRTKKINQEIYIAKSGTKKIFGKVTITDCKEIKKENLEILREKHLVSNDALNNMKYYQKKKIYGWDLDNPEYFETPISYNHPNGAQTWVTYKDNI